MPAQESASRTLTGPDATDAELREDPAATIARLQSENAELRASLLRWRMAAVAKWSDIAAEAMKTASEVKDLKRALIESERDRFDIGERHHQLNQIHHQLNERYLTMSRRYGKVGRLTEITSSDVKRRIVRVVGKK